MPTTIDTLLVRIEADMSDLRRDLNKVTQQTEKHTQKMANSFRMVGRAIAALGGAALFGGFIKSTIQTGAQIEGLKVQLNALLGSADEGARAFDKMAEFAQKVPFSLEQIQKGSGSLAAASDNADELRELMQITGNIAAQFNIPFEEAAANVQRALSAGAGAADQFRDRGVLAFAGFQAGVSYSASETAKILQDNFGTGGTADGAMDDFAKTTNGALSMLGDAVFNFKATVAQAGLTDAFTDIVNSVTDLINNSRVFAFVVGAYLGKALTALKQALQFVIDKLDELLMAITIFIATNLALSVAKLAVRFVYLARSITAAGMAQKIFTLATRKTFLAVGMLAGAVFLAAQQFPVFEEKLTNLLDKVKGALPEEILSLGDDFQKVVADANKAIREAEAAGDADPSTIDIGGASVDTTSILKMRDLIDKTRGSTRGLEEDLKKLKAIGRDSELFEGAQDAIKRITHQIKMEADPAFRALVDGATALGDSVTHAFRSMLDETHITMADFGKMVQSAVKDVIAQIFRLTVINQILNSLFPGLGLETMSFGEIFTGKAGGGTVQPRTPVLVGERGPELFVPSGAGTIMNNMNTNNALSGAGGTVVNQTINISTGVAQTVRTEVQSMLPQIAEASKMAVLDARRRGGSFASAF